MQAQVEQMESRGSVKPPVSPACSLMGSLPFQPGLGPQTRQHGN